MTTPETWPIVLHGNLNATALGQLNACFDRAFEVASVRGRQANSVNFFELYKANRGPMVEATLQPFLDSPAALVLAEKLGPNLALLLDYCTFRYHEPGREESRLEYHFDANFLGGQHMALNAWVTLTEAGRDAPGLTFLKPDIDQAPMLARWKQTVDALRRNQTGPAAVDVAFSEEDVNGVCGRPDGTHLDTPLMAAGDCLIFHQFVLHATQPMSGAHEVRRSIEFRVADPARLPRLFAARRRPFIALTLEQGRWRIGREALRASA